MVRLTESTGRSVDLKSFELSDISRSEDSVVPDAIEREGIVGFSTPSCMNVVVYRVTDGSADGCRLTWSGCVDDIIRVNEKRNILGRHHVF